MPIAHVSCSRGACPETLLALIVAICLFPSATAASTLNVICGDPNALYPTIKAALDTLPLNSPTEPNSINITGTCTENVILYSRQRITIQAAPGAQTAKIVAPDSNSDVLSVNKSRNVVLRGIVISGGWRGVMIQGSSEVEMDQCTIEQASGVGIQVNDMSNLRLDRTTIRNNGSHGLMVDDSSFASVGEKAVQGQLIHIHNNGGSGISVTNSAVMVRGLTIIEDNASTGVSLAGSRFLLRGIRAENLVLNNGSFGVNVSEGSSAMFSGSNTIRHNGGFGIQVGRSSTATFSEVTTSDGWAGYTVIENNDQLGANIAAGGTALFAGRHKIRGNGGAPESPDKTPYRGGFRVATGAHLSLRLGSEVTDNIGQGIWVEVGASVGLGYPAEIPGATVNRNTKEGVAVIRGASLWIVSPSTVSDNGIANISCDNSAWLFGDITGIRLIKCENVLRDGETKK